MRERLDVIGGYCFLCWGLIYSNNICFRVLRWDTQDKHWEVTTSRAKMAYIWMAIALLLACSLITEARPRRKLNKARRCEKITVSSCGNFAYQRTKFPNPFTNITTQDETSNLTAFIPALTRLNCTATDPMPFLCSVYVPVCTPDLRTVIPPCREFCEKAVGSCPALMAATYGIQWPSPLDCSNYPSKKGGQICLSKLKYRTNKNKNGKRKGKKFWNNILVLMS
jgi:hypothetical protein